MMEAVTSDGGSSRAPVIRDPSSISPPFPPRQPAGRSLGLFQLAEVILASYFENKFIFYKACIIHKISLCKV